MFDASIIYLAALMEVELPSRTVRLCDGGIINWPSVGIFSPQDDEFGVIGSADPGDESIGDEAPAGTIGMLCPSAEAMVALADPENQGARIKLWIAETDAGGTVIGTPELQFIGLIDTLQIELDQGQFNVTIEYVSEAERLFWVKEGNVLSSRFHQTAWPGEKGFDFCTGVGKQVPWGVAGVPRGGSSASGFFSGIAAQFGG